MKSLLASRNRSAVLGARFALGLFLAAGMGPALRASEVREAPGAVTKSDSRAQSAVVKGLLRERSGKPVRGRTAGARPLGAAACFTQNIPCNTTIASQLTTDDCLFPADDSFYDAWQFPADAGDRVRIHMAAGFDTVLFLFDPQGNLAAFNDDTSSTDLNSLIEFTLNASGVWTIWANSYDDGETGTYSLDLTCTFVIPPPTCTASPTTLCLNSDRFRVQVSWSVPSQGASGVGTASELTSDTGYFWFFSANNIELV
ncbi:MAG: PPC domain-containing protein, partial [Acidobacteriota bacterium]